MMLIFEHMQEYSRRVIEFETGYVFPGSVEIAPLSSNLFFAEKRMNQSNIRLAKKELRVLPQYSS